MKKLTKIQVSELINQEGLKAMMLLLLTVWDGARCIADLADILHKSPRAAEVISLFFSTVLLNVRTLLSQ